MLSLKSLPWLAGLALLLLLQYRIWFDDSGVLASRILEARLADLNEELRVQKEKNRQLLVEIQDLRTSEDVLEEKAREDLGLVKEGETLFLFVEPEQ